MNKIRWLSCNAALGALLLTGGAIAESGHHSGGRSDAPAIVGAWQVEITVRINAPDCTTAPPVPFGPNPFPALNTFHVGGTLSETGSRSPPSMRSPGHGVWEQVGRRSFEARYTFQGFDANGFLATNMDIRSEIVVDAGGDTFSGVARLDFSDISGNTSPFCATLNGVRFSL